MGGYSLSIFFSKYRDDVIRLFMQTSLGLRACGNGDPEGIRTPDQQIRNLLLYPAELRDLIKIQKFNLWNNDFRGWTFFVGVAGFEPTTFCSQSRRDTGLRYTPKTGTNVRLFRLYSTPNSLRAQKTWFEQRPWVQQRKWTAPKFFLRHWYSIIRNFFHKKWNFRKTPGVSGPWFVFLVN